LPAGYLPLADRKRIAAALGAGDDLAEDAGSHGVGEDPDYITGGQDSLTFEVALDELPPARLSHPLFAKVERRGCRPQPKKTAPQQGGRP
jgi:hypothetical protein